MSVDAHLERAERHKTVGNALESAAGEEWAAVCYFYSAYHLVRYALRNDPIFEDEEALRSIHRDLHPELRTLERHKGRIVRNAPRQWGINEIVGFLYRPIAGYYERLHQASISVRYDDGFKQPVSESGSWLTAIWKAHEAGKLQAKRPG